MKIKSQLILNTVLPVTGALVIAGVLFFTSHRVEEEMERGWGIQKIALEADLLDRITQELLRDPTEPLRDQWRESYRVLKTDLQTLVPRAGREKSLRDRLLNIDRRLGQVFDDRPGTAARVADPREDGAQAPLKIMTQELVFYARQWLDLNRETVRRMKNRSDRIILLFIGLLAVALGTLSLLLIRSLVPPLEALRKGTRIIGSGQLDFKLHVPARNEMGELAEGFNQMGDQLKTARESLHKALNRSLQSEKDLKNYQNHLKDVVHQRTQDLWEANKLLEKQIQERQGAETRLKKLLEEKEILLREINHRAKNNMQTIASLLWLQSRDVGEEKYAAMFQESANRIQAMALVHEKIFGSQNLARIDGRDYLNSLVQELFVSYGLHHGDIRLRLEVEAVHLDIHTGIPLGLIINELVSNSLKHAFRNRRQGELQIALGWVKPDRCKLTVADDGAPFPPDLDFRHARSLGLQIVTTLVENQLNGTITLHHDGTKRFEIEFPCKAERTEQASSRLSG